MAKNNNPVNSSDWKSPQYNHDYHAAKLIKFPLDKTPINGNDINKNNGDYVMGDAVLLAINQKMFEDGLITKAEKEKIEMEILREE